MGLSVYSRRIDEILGSRERNAPQADMLLDQYIILQAQEEREEFVAALIHRLLVDRARRGLRLTA